MKRTELKKEAKPINIVICGNGPVARGAFRKLHSIYRNKLKSGCLKIFLLSTADKYVFYPLMHEYLAGAASMEQLSLPIEEVFADADIIYGRATSIDKNKNRIQFEDKSGDFYYLEYDHLVLEPSYFTNHLSETKADRGFIIQSTLDLLKTSRQLEYLAIQAARLRDKMSAARLLRITVYGDGQAGFDLALAVKSAIKKHLHDLEQPDLNPTIYLIGELRDRLPFSEAREDLPGFLKLIGIKYIPGKKVTRVNSDGAILNDGSFIHCSLVFNTDANSKNPMGDFSGLLAVPNVSVDHDGLLSNSKNIWIGEIDECTSLPRGNAYFSKLATGKQIAKNISRNIALRPAKRIEPKTDLQILKSGPENTAVYIKGIALRGMLANWISIIMMHLASPCGGKYSILKSIIRSHHLSKKQSVQSNIIKTAIENAAKLNSGAGGLSADYFKQLSPA